MEQCMSCYDLIDVYVVIYFHILKCSVMQFKVLLYFMVYFNGHIGSMGLTDSIRQQSKIATIIIVIVI